MAVDEHTRRVLYERLEDVLGLEAATALMEHLPPVGWADVATKRDIDALAVATKRDIDALAVATKRDMDALAVATKRDMDALAVATKRDMDALGDRLRAEFRAELHQLHGAVTSQTRTLFVGFVTVNAATVGIAAAIAQVL